MVEIEKDWWLEHGEISHWHVNEPNFHPVIENKNILSQNVQGKNIMSQRDEGGLVYGKPVRKIFCCTECHKPVPQKTTNAYLMMNLL